MRDDLVQRYRTFSDERIEEMHADRDDYEAEAVEAMELVLAERGLEAAAPTVEARETVNATITIWEEVLPVHRVTRYDDPLIALLEKTEGGEVSGSGSQLTEDGRVEFVDITMEIVDDDELIEALLVELTELGAPKHSKLMIEDGDDPRELTFGVAEGVGVLIRSLPSESDETALINGISDALGPDVFSSLRGGYGVRDHEWAFYVYGYDAEVLWERMEPVVTASPLCRGAHIVVRCGHPDGSPRALTMPS
jgi:hypothetical protein